METGIKGAVGIQPSNTLSGLATQSLKVAAHQYLAVRLDSQAGHRPIRGRIERPIQRTIWEKTAQLAACEASQNREITPNQNLPVRL
jgi:hypothetical protein